jgi:hypothetical protein
MVHGSRLTAHGGFLAAVEKLSACIASRGLLGFLSMFDSVAVNVLSVGIYVLGDMFKPLDG